MSPAPDDRRPSDVLGDRTLLRRAAEAAVTRHRELAADRRAGDGRLGDAELTDFLLAAYPTVAGQRN